MRSILNKRDEAPVERDGSGRNHMAKEAEGPADKLALYEKLVATQPGVERKGASMPYTSVNGHMFSFLTKEGKLALRLPAEERDAFLKRYKARLCEQHGS